MVLLSLITWRLGKAPGNIQVGVPQLISFISTMGILFEHIEEEYMPLSSFIFTAVVATDSGYMIAGIMRT